MNLKYQFIPIVVILIQFCNANKNLESCNVQNLEHRAYGYRDFIEVSSIKTNLPKHNERLHMKFYVMTSMEAHILLSENNSPNWEFPVYFNFHFGCIDLSVAAKHGRGYEIVLGGYGNTLSWISTGKSIGISRNTEVNSPNILSSLDPIPVEIIQTNEGELIVNVPGHRVPLLKYLDMNPVNIKYFSFGTYGGNSAKWFYNCPLDVYSNTDSPRTIAPRKKANKTFLSLLTEIKDLKKELNELKQNQITTEKPKIDIRIG
ncbi:uncharacterized protein LOC129905904 [Episyrphus balteatus]|uniref:uncharacterized protein LOC129905904 n=1 Tax=Episyrphus balteatus TaxID=286459 RepID=UPI0024860062|nr:uncharacterized protein LOC129905904 [Episyrphus balteatus]